MPIETPDVKLPAKSMKALEEAVEQGVAASLERIDDFVCDILRKRIEQLVGHAFGFKRTHWNEWEFNARDAEGNILLRLIQEKVSAQMDALLKPVLEKERGVFDSKKALASARKHYQEAYKEAFQSELYERVATDARERAKENAYIVLNELLGKVVAEKLLAEDKEEDDGDTA